MLSEHVASEKGAVLYLHMARVCPAAGEPIHRKWPPAAVERSGFIEGRYKRVQEFDVQGHSLPPFLSPTLVGRGPGPAWENFRALRWPS